jgi:hypothetical protein
VHKLFIFLFLRRLRLDHPVFAVGSEIHLALKVGPRSCDSQVGCIV